MFYREILGVLLELGADGISPRPHQFGYQLMSALHRRRRLVDKSCLVGFPCLAEPLAVLPRKVADGKVVHPFGPSLEFGLGFVTVAEFSYGAVVLGTEAAG